MEFIKPESATRELLSGSKGKSLTIGLGIMATQASAITFLSTAGQALLMTWVSFNSTLEC